MRLAGTQHENKFKWCFRLLLEKRSNQYTSQCGWEGVVIYGFVSVALKMVSGNSSTVQRFCLDCQGLLNCLENIEIYENVEVNFV
jgi:hypothetical protein